MSEDVTIPGFSPTPALMASLGGGRLLSWSADPGRAEVEFTARRDFCHTNGTIVQGGFITAWLDQAIAFAAIAHSGAKQIVFTLDISVKFLERVGPGTVIAKARVLRWGRRAAFFEAQLCSPDGKLLAMATATTVPAPYTPPSAVTPAI